MDVTDLNHLLRVINERCIGRLISGNGYELDYSPPKSLYQLILSTLFLSPMENPKIICKYLTTKKVSFALCDQIFPWFVVFKDDATEGH